MLKYLTLIILSIGSLKAISGKDLVDAAAAGDIAAVKRLVEIKHIPIDSTREFSFRERVPGTGIIDFTRRGVSALFAAVENQHFPIVAYLLNHRANINQAVEESSVNLTPLPDISPRKTIKLYPISIALRNKDYDMVEYLFKRGAQLADTDIKAYEQFQRRYYTGANLYG